MELEGASSLKNQRNQKEKVDAMVQDSINNTRLVLLHHLQTANAMIHVLTADSQQIQTEKSIALLVNQV